MESCGRDDEIERSLGGVEVLERRHLEADCRVGDVASGCADHGGTDVDRIQPEAEGRQVTGQLSSATPDLEHCGTRAEPGGADDGVDNFARIASTRRVIKFGELIEQNALTFPFSPFLAGFRAHLISLAAEDTSCGLSPIGVRSVNR